MRTGWQVYMLRCADGSIYTGITTDLSRRLQVHNNGTGAAYTRSRLPVQLLWFDPADDRSSALKRELQIKRLPRDGKLALCAGTD